MDRPLHVLIVEDDPLTALMLAEVLAELVDNGSDASFAIAATEHQAVELAERRHPDLITTDVRLEQGSGPAAVAAIQRRGAVPVVYVTGSPDLLDEALRPVTVVKPVFKAALRAALAAALERCATPPPPLPSSAGSG